MDTDPNCCILAFSTYNYRCSHQVTANGITVKTALPGTVDATPCIKLEHRLAGAADQVEQNFTIFVITFS